MSLLVDRLHVAAFRGIGDPVELDLSAPLTLLYAPNGTGKTSIFNALRWLIHGKDYDKDEIRHQSPRASGPPTVRASGSLFEHDGASRPLICQRSGSAPANGAVAGQSVRGLDLLRQLAQAHDLSEFEARGGGQNKRYQDVIRATRFLSADLEEAMDLHAEGTSLQELRQLLFADLTNTTNLTAEARQVAGYRKKLGEKSREIQAQLEDSRKILDRLESRLSTLPALDACTAAVVAAFGMASAQDDPRALFARAQQMLEAWTTSSELHAAALADLRPFAISRVDDERRSEQLDRQISEIAPSLARNQETAFALESEIAGLDSRNEALVTRYHQVAERTERLEKLLGSAPELSDIQPTLMVAEPGFTSPSEAEVLALARIVAAQSDWTQLLSDLKACVDAIARTRAGIEQHPAPASSELEQAEAELHALENALQFEAERREELRRLALGWQEQAHASRCPCCDHDWGTAKALVAALSKAAPSSSQAVSRRLKLRAQIDSLRTQREAWQARAASLDSLKKSERTLQSQLAPYRRLADTLGIDLEDTDPVALTARRNRQATAYGTELASIVSTGDSPMPAMSAALNRLADEGTRLQAELASNAQVLMALRRRRDDANAEHARLQQFAANVSAQRANLLARLGQGNAHAARLNLASVNETTIEASQRDHDNAIRRDARARAALKGLREALDAQQLPQEIQNQRALVESLNAALSRIADETERAGKLDDFLKDSIDARGRQVFDSLQRPISELFGHMQINRTFERIGLDQATAGFSMRGLLDGETGLDPRQHFSQGQQQDLALALFLARAATLGGSFFLDEPLRHLDDLNRAALLDVLRAAVIGTQHNRPPLRLLVTTASRMVLEHLVQKFQPLMPQTADTPLLRVYELQGNPRTGVRCGQVFPPESRSDPNGPSGATPPPEPLPQPSSTRQTAISADNEWNEETLLDMESLTYRTLQVTTNEPHRLPPPALDESTS